MTHHDMSGVPTAYTRARTRKAPIGNDASSSVMRHAGRGIEGKCCLIPFDRREGCQIEEAAEVAGKSVRTMRLWAEQHHIARRVGGGHWIFSRVALQMLLDGNEVALAAYLDGDRSSPVVVAYYERDGLRDLIQRWRSFGSAKAAILP